MLSRYMILSTLIRYIAIYLQFSQIILQSVYGRTHKLSIDEKDKSNQRHRNYEDKIKQPLMRDSRHRNRWKKDNLILKEGNPIKIQRYHSVREDFHNLNSRNTSLRSSNESRVYFHLNSSLDRYQTYEDILINTFRYSWHSMSKQNLSLLLSQFGYPMPFRALHPIIAVDVNACQLRDSISGELRRHRVLLFIDIKFFSLFQNWYSHFLDICGEQRKDSLEIVCMDVEVQNYLTTLNLNCSAMSFSFGPLKFLQKQTEIWSKRMEILLLLLETGTDLLLSDIDALWLRDPYPILNKHIKSSDIISSRGSWPETISNVWGSSLCMGFIFIKATRFSLALMQAVKHHMNMTKPDDQLSINRVLYASNITWSKRPMLYAYNIDPDFGSVDFFGVQKNVTLLEHSQFIRNCTRQKSISKNTNLSKQSKVNAQRAIENGVVAHCSMSPGQAHKKFMSLLKFGLWHPSVLPPEKYNNKTEEYTTSVVRRRQKKPPGNNSTKVNLVRDSRLGKRRSDDEDKLQANGSLSYKTLITPIVSGSKAVATELTVENRTLDFFREIKRMIMRPKMALPNLTLSGLPGMDLPQDRISVIDGDLLLQSKYKNDSLSSPVFKIE